MSEALTDIRVLDASRILAGPYCSMVLGDWGADVIKVERPGGGDDTRTWGPPFVGTESTYYLCCNRNKRSVTLNLQSAEGVRILKELAARSDVFIENFTPGVAKRLGVDYAALKEVNPRIVYCTITGFGPDGPSAQKAGYDMVLSAVGGLMSITGEEEGGPVKVGVAITDVVTGVFAAAAILAALRARDRTGTGQHIDLSLLETQVACLINIGSSFLGSGKMPRRWGSAHESIVPYQAFETSDGWATLCVGNDRMWKDFCRAFRLEDLGKDPRYETNASRVKHRKELIEALSKFFKTMTRKEVLDTLESASIPCGPINTIKEVFEDPQVLHRKMLVEVDHPTAGKLKMAGIPVKFSETEASIRRPPPTLGEHTLEVLGEVLGYERARVEALRGEGIV